MSVTLIQGYQGASGVETRHTSGTQTDVQANTAHFCDHLFESESHIAQAARLALSS